MTPQKHGNWFLKFLLNLVCPPTHNYHDYVTFVIYNFNNLPLHDLPQDSSHKHLLYVRNKIGWSLSFWGIYRAPSFDNFHRKFERGGNTKAQTRICTESVFKKKKLCSIIIPVVI